VIRAVDGFLAAQSQAQLVSGSFALVAIIGLIDHLTGYELAFSIFYAIPIGISSWYVGNRPGIAVCIVSGITWLAVDFTSAHPYSHPAIPFWNMGVRVAFFIVLAHLLARLRSALELQSALAQQDGLTGIMNARAFRRQCEFVTRLAARHKHTIALGYLDLDDFKGVNDTLGHGVGDYVLTVVASELASRLRASDFVGRLGGDEFAVLLSKTDLAGARIVFSTMRERLVDLAARNGWPIGFSIGVAVFHSLPASADDALRCADELMYRVKSTGKNNILIEEYPGESRGA
jgi:diguanylate cyclase (GGDEF)-like protein